MKKLVSHLLCTFIAVFLIASPAWSSPLKYGNTYHVINNRGFLDVCGRGCNGNLYCVDLNNGEFKQDGADTWQIQSASGKNFGEVVSNGDIIHLLNLYKRDGGFLDIRDRGEDGYSNFSVSTATVSNRDRGSGTWRIQRAGSASSRSIEVNETVKLINGYEGFKGGFLESNIAYPENSKSIYHCPHAYDAVGTLKDGGFNDVWQFEQAN